MGAVCCGFSPLVGRPSGGVYWCSGWLAGGLGTTTEAEERKIILYTQFIIYLELMKTLLLCLISCLCSAAAFSQSFQGTWDGSFTYYMGSTRLPSPGSDVPLILKFELNTDSSYKITSITNRGYDEVTCSIFCRKQNGDTVVLQEMRVIKGTQEAHDLMIMTLKIMTRKKSTYLEGTWAYSSSQDIPRGEISVYKKK